MSLNPISLARTLPGAVELSGTQLYGSGPESSFSVNGQRFRANNYLLDSTDNNEFTLTGIAQPFNIADAVEEVSVQTGNFGVEFGRATGGVFNVVTKSGTNSVHGTLLWRYQSQRFNSVSNLDKLNNTPQSVFSRNVYGFTVGGLVRKDKTFFFGAFQQDSRRSTQSFLFTDHYIFSPAWTNEFRFSYARLDGESNRISPESGPLAKTLPRLSIPLIDSPGTLSSNLQLKKANNWLFQETQSKLSGRHTFRYGVEFLGNWRPRVLPHFSVAA
jgi:hypothetical protein